MEESVQENRRIYFSNKIEKLKADIGALESNLADGDSKYHSNFLPVEPSIAMNGDKSILGRKCPPAKLSKLLELSSKASGFKLESFSRKLRFNPGGLYLYDCLLEGRTSSLKFIAKFVETVQTMQKCSGDGATSNVARKAGFLLKCMCKLESSWIQGPGCECGEISSLESEAVMSKGDPESLTDWISECCKAGDLAVLIHGLIEFTELANNRRSILRSLYRRGKSGQLGSCSFSVVGEEDGVMVVGVGPKNVNLFSIKWKIVYFPPMKSMKSTFSVSLHEKDLQYESAEVFAALQRPYITEEDLPLLWDSVADTLTSYC